MTGLPTRAGSVTKAARWCSPLVSPWSRHCIIWTSVSRVTLFWAAFILTRPLGATVGDFLDKPVSQGGLSLSRPLASAIITALIVVLIILLPQRAGRHPGVDAQK